jgi:hypothetical protein
MHSLLLSGWFVSVDISAGLKWLIYKHFYHLQEVRKKVHYFVNTSITATWMSVEVSHALQVCQWLAVGWWFSPGTPISSTNKIDLSEKKRNIIENGDKQNQKQT